ncbi:MAG: ornithine carbamoyltransferase [Thermofilum sp. ex4484_82]|nr:MAG: ornithine carbamoyltransferase [Thermofilum sp. ex4484_82]OYT39960.1 MAG: ornithine carbamoyltransferase [Archaeoglobales archaeon ex4484_92]
MRHLLNLVDYGSGEIMEIINLAIKFKKDRKRGLRVQKFLEGKSIALIFEKPSTRTKASLMVAINELGGFVYSFTKDELQLGRGEPVKDTARVLSRYFDMVIARVYRHEDLEIMAQYSSIPVVNALSDKFHPLQALADIQTILEKKGKLKGLKIAFIGDGTDNVLNSLIVVSAKLGLYLSIACPREYSPDLHLLESLLDDAEKSGAFIEVTEDPKEAANSADVIYTDVFVSMGQEAEREKRIKIFMPRYQVSSDLLKLAKDDCIFMHCLPAHRGEEVVDEVIENSKHSVVLDQAENRLHTAKAVLKHLLE